MSAPVHPGVAPPEVVEPQRPAEVVELTEFLYRRIFSFGLIVATVMAFYAIVLSAIRPEGNGLRGVVICGAVSGLCLVALALRARWYRVLRRYPAVIAVPALVVGGASWLVGDPNDQMFYVVIIVLGVTGLTVPFGYVVGSTFIAGFGCTAPLLFSTQPGVTSSAIAAVTIPTIFWLIIEQLARYVLRAYGETAEGLPWERDGGVPGDGGGTGSRSAAGSRQRWRPSLFRGRERPLLPVGGSEGDRGVNLSARQLEVVLLCAEGLDHSEIAACLEIGAQQVRKHLRLARERTGSATTAQLIAWSIRNGLVSRSMDRAPV